MENPIPSSAKLRYCSKLLKSSVEKMTAKIIADIVPGLHWSNFNFFSFVWCLFSVVLYLYNYLGHMKMGVLSCTVGIWRVQLKKHANFEVFIFLILKKGNWFTASQKNMTQTIHFVWNILNTWANTKKRHIGH